MVNVVDRETFFPQNQPVDPSHLDREFTNIKYLWENRIGIDVERNLSVGDGVKDATREFKKAITDCKNTGLPLLLRPNRNYLVKENLWLGADDEVDPWVVGIIGWDSKITFQTTGVAMDWTGARGPSRYMVGVEIVGDSTTTPTVGLLLARPTTAPQISSGKGLFLDMATSGSFSTCAVYNLCSEENYWLNCNLVNDEATSLIMSQKNSYSITSPNATVASSSSTQQWFSGCTFNAFRTAGTVVSTDYCIEIASWSGVQICDSWFNQASGDGSHILLKQESAGIQCNNISIRDSLFHGTYDSGVVFSGDSHNRIYVSGNQWATNVTADIVLQSTANLLACELECRDLDGSAASVDVFDNTQVFLRTVGGTAGSFNVSRTFEGVLYCNSGDSVTLPSGGGSRLRGLWIEGDSGKVMRLGDDIDTFADGDATPDVSRTRVATTANTTGTTITALDGGRQGQHVVIIAGDGNTTFDFTGTTLKGNNGVDYTASAGDRIDCIRGGTNWHCLIGQA